MKKFLKVGVIALVLKIALGVALVLYVDNLLKKGFEKFESDKLGISVSIDKVFISVFTGSIGINGLSIANPSGFSKKYALTSANLDIKFDILSLLNKVVKIDELQINNPVFYFETNDEGISNLDTLKSYLKAMHIPIHVTKNNMPFMAYINGEAIQYKEIIIKKAVVLKLTVKNEDEVIPAHSTSLNLANIGKKEGGISIQAATERIMGYIFRATDSLLQN